MRFGIKAGVFLVLLVLSSGCKRSATTSSPEPRFQPEKIAAPEKDWEYCMHLDLYKRRVEKDPAQLPALVRAVTDSTFRQHYCSAAVLMEFCPLEPGERKSVSAECKEACRVYEEIGLTPEIKHLIDVLMRDDYAVSQRTEAGGLVVQFIADPNARAALENVKKQLQEHAERVAFIVFDLWNASVPLSNDSEAERFRKSQRFFDIFANTDPHRAIELVVEYGKRESKRKPMALVDLTAPFRLDLHRLKPDDLEFLLSLLKKQENIQLIPSFVHSWEHSLTADNRDAIFSFYYDFMKIYPSLPRVPYFVAVEQMEQQIAVHYVYEAPQETLATSRYLEEEVWALLINNTCAADYCSPTELMRLLGKRKITRAVPALEKCLLEAWPACSEAAGAIGMITGRAPALPPECKFPGFPPGVDKPILYLYPHEDTLVTVKFTDSRHLKVSYPAYPDDGWRVWASKDGTLTDAATGKKFYALYWESRDSWTGELPEGFVVRGQETAAFLEEKLEAIGLNFKEREEFIVYWLPRMVNNAYNIIYFDFDDYAAAYPIEIDPKPNHHLRFLMRWKSSATEVSVREQALPAFDRSDGFTAVEWGGVELSSR